MRKKTIAMITVGMNGLWIDNLESIQHEREFKARPGGWVAQMLYEENDSGWEATAVNMAHGSALTLPAKDWIELPEFINSGEGVVGVRDSQKVHKLVGGDLNWPVWIERLKETMGNRDFSEFDNFFAFRAPENIVIHPSIMRNRHGDIVIIRLTFGKKVELE